MKHTNIFVSTDCCIRQYMLLTLFFCVTIFGYAQRYYRDKYSEVIKYYSKSSSDSLKLRAAYFLIDNMDGHVSPEGDAMDVYIERLRDLGKVKGIKELSQEWTSATQNGDVSLVPDSSVISSKMLIDNIEESFAAWNEAPWADSISFSHFCHYILPYRCKNEHYNSQWRRQLREQYKDLLVGVTDMNQAFSLVRDSVLHRIKLSNPYCSYTLDPLICNIIQRAECDQRCVVLTSVLRALGIPAAMDVIPFWADYSSKGHSWVALVHANGDTYTVTKDKDTPKTFNPIDASVFQTRYRIKEQDHCPYQIKYTKTPSKVYRIAYQRQGTYARDMPSPLNSPFIQDVSAWYGLTNSVRFKTDLSDPVCLCTYVSSIDWIPVSVAYPHDGYVCFDNVGSGVVCLPISVSIEGNKAIHEPVLIDKDGTIKSFLPSANEFQTIRINRKYPLCSYITDTWGYMRGAVFEASNDSLFQEVDTLAKIKTMPYGMTEIPCVSKEIYRFLRYRATPINRSSLAEIQFFSKDSSGKEEMLEGTPFYDGVLEKNVPMLFDGNPATSCKGLKTGYHVGIDLGDGNARQISKICFSPSTDRNFVEQGHLYELYYFDREWHLLGRKIGTNGYLEFSNVPKGALLLLKDKTAGREERIFEYAEGRQIWH